MPLTGDVNNSEHLVTMQCSDSLTHTTCPNAIADQVHPVMATALPNGCCPPAGRGALTHHKTCSGRGIEQRAQGVKQASEFPTSQSTEHLWYVVEQVPNPQYTGPKGSTRGVPDTTGHPQRSYDHAFTC